MRYYPKIDGLRFVAITLVLIEHYAQFIGRFIYAGFYGVDLFFTLSGFLVTSILLKQRDGSFGQRYGRFLWRRTLRIFPIYYLTLAILWLLHLDVVRDSITALATYTFNYSVVTKHLANSPITPYWSLCVEEQFYLFWPFLILSFNKNIRFLIACTAALILVAYAQQIFNIFPGLSEFNYHGLLTRMGSLGLGALGAMASRKDLSRRWIFQSKAAEVLAMAVLLFSLVVTFKFKLLVLGICSLFFILKAAYFGFRIGAVDRFLSHKWVIYIGTISYGIYIFHMPVAYFLDKYVSDVLWAKIEFSKLGYLSKLEWHRWIFTFPVYSTLSVLLAAASFRWFEKPITKLKDKFSDQRRTYEPAADHVISG